jgi:hypothetical protein
MLIACDRCKTSVSGKCGSFTNTHHDRHGEDDRRRVTCSTPIAGRFFGSLDCSIGHDSRIRERMHRSASGQLALMSISRVFVLEDVATSRTRDCDERRPATLDGKVLCAGSARDAGHRTGNERPSLRCRALDRHGMNLVAGAGLSAMIARKSCSESGAKGEGSPRSIPTG